MYFPAKRAVQQALGLETAGVACSTGREIGEASEIRAEIRAAAVS